MVPAFDLVHASKGNFMIEIFLAMDCRSEPVLRDHLRQALGEKAVENSVVFHRIAADEAERRGIRGSPAIFLDGKEVLPAGIEVSGFS